jgi:hypothetical protein
MTTITENKRKLVNHVAGNFLTDQSEGDLYDAYLKLKEIQPQTDYLDEASNYVEVCEDVDTISVHRLVEFIEAGVQSLESLFSNVPEIITKIDFSVLKLQKNDLINVIDSLTLEAAIHVKNVRQSVLSDEMHKQINSLTGILHTIDALQDYAVDVLNYNEKDVFETEID